MWQTILGTFVSISVLVTYGYLFIFLPAWLFVRDLNVSKLEKVTISLVLGFGCYSIFVYGVRFFGLPFWFGELILLLLSIGMIRKNGVRLRLKKIKLTKQQALFVILAIGTALIHSAVLFRSGIQTPQGISFVELSFHDSMQHISFIERLYNSGHVTHPGFGGAELKNYHYLIDSSLASLTRFSFVSLYDTYYRIYPIFISLVFSLSIFVFTRRLTRSEIASNLAVVFTIFAANASFYAQYIRGTEFTWGANTFLINPIVDILQNPASIFVLAQMLIVLLLVKTYKQTNYWHVIVIGLVAGSMIGFKAWGGLLIHGMLGVGALWQLLKYRDPKLFVALMLSGIISAGLFLPGYQPETSASPVWAPGWSLHRMLNDADRWNNIPDLWQEETFIFQQNWLQLSKLYFKWVLVYFLGNYWVRAIGFFAILGLSLKTIRLKTFEICVLSISIASFVLPLLFNQGRMAYDIEQFAPYALVLASIATVILVKNTSDLIDKKFSIKLPWVPIVIFTIFLSAPSNYTSIKARTTGDTRLVTNDELTLFNYIKQSTPTDSVFIVFPSHRNVATLEFAALSARDTFYSGRTLSVITGHDFDTRYEQELSFFQNMNTAERQTFIETYKIDYIFMYKEDLEYVKDKNFDYKPIYENSAGAVFKV